MGKATERDGDFLVRWELCTAHVDEKVERLLAAGWEPFAVHREQHSRTEWNVHAECSETTKTNLTIYHFRREVDDA